MAGDSTLYFTVRKGATALPNRVALNRELSIQARGVLLVLCARPQGAPMGYRALMGQGMGETALRSALRELEAAGHRWRFRLRSGVYQGCWTGSLLRRGCPHVNESASL